MKRNYDFKKGAVIRGPIKSKSQVEAALKEQQKTLTSIRLDADIVEVAKEKADEEGVGYLTWLNKKLREAVLNEMTLSEELKKRIEKLEKAVFKKRVG
jgi:uncharacterized protein (DUF4415 family)